MLVLVLRSCVGNHTALSLGGSIITSGPAVAFTTWPRKASQNSGAPQMPAMHRSSVASSSSAVVISIDTRTP